MKNLILAVILVLLPLTATLALDTNKVQYRKITNNSFIPGENLEYEINYGFITAGTATVSVNPQFTEVNGRKCYLIEVNAKSAPGFEFIYKFRQTYKCYLDAEGMFTWLVDQDKLEGNKAEKIKMEFQHFPENSKVTRTEEKDGTTKSKDIPIDMYSLDDIGTYFYARTLDFTNKQIGETSIFPYVTKDEKKDLGIKFLGRENTDVPAGEFKCIVVQPMLREAALASKVDDIFVWLTDDEYKMPVKIQMKIIIGSIKVELKSYSGLAGPLKTKID
jgi:hypothetical protein